MKHCKDNGNYHIPRIETDWAGKVQILANNLQKKTMPFRNQNNLPMNEMEGKCSRNLSHIYL